MNTTETPCISCGTPWTSHKKIISLCAEYAELKRLYAELVLECAAAKDRNVAYRLQALDLSYQIVELQDKVKQQIDGWISMSDDNLPPLNVEVLMYCNKHFCIGGRTINRDLGGWQWSDTDGDAWYNLELNVDHDYKPTHWMKLPESPRN